MSTTEKYPLLIGHYSQGPKELRGIKEVAEFISTEGRYEDLTIRTPDNRFLLSTYGMYLNKIDDLEYRSELLKVLVPMQQQTERRAFASADEEDDEEIEDEEFEEADELGMDNI